MAYNNPSITDFKTYFFRDFPYGTDINVNVLDQDIGNALVQAGVAINPCLFANQGIYTLGYEYLGAHYLVENMRASSQGINGKFDWLHAGKGVGSVNQSFSIPQRILDHVIWSMYTTTNYGMMYLQLLMPQLCGQVMSVRGTTRA